ncbi:MAG: hypothetical protein V1914_02800 [archaeon]
MKKSTKIILSTIFLAVLLLRLYFAFQTSHFSSDDAYFNIRHSEYITEHFQPIVHDDLSYGGRFILNSHIFHYILAIFNWILPGMLAYKLIPAILTALLVFLVFAIAKEITNNETAALFSALIVGVMPISFKMTLNQVSVYSLVLLLLLYVIYTFFDLRHNINKFIIISLLLPLVHPIGFFFAVSMMVYLLLAGLESIKVDELSKESIILVLFFNLLIAFILFKDAFLTTGLGAVWQNVPSELLSSYFRNINVFEIITGIGIIPIVFGIIGFLFALKAKKKSIYVLSAFVLTDFLLLALKMIDFNTGLMILGLLLIIISAIAFDKFIAYLNMTKFLRFKRIVAGTFILIIILSLGIPSIIVAKDTMKNSLSQEEFETFTWIKLNTPQDATILAGIDEGNYVTYIAERKNVADNFFLLAPNRYSDIEELFKTQSLVKAIDLIKKYKITHIYLSERTKKIYNIKELVYTRDENCFEKVFYTSKLEVYRIIC